MVYPAGGHGADLSVSSQNFKKKLGWDVVWGKEVPRGLPRNICCGGGPIYSHQNLPEKLADTVGESLKKETIELLTLIFRANSRKDKHEVFQEA